MNELQRVREANKAYDDNVKKIRELYKALREAEKVANELMLEVAEAEQALLEAARKPVDVTLADGRTLTLKQGN